MAMLASPVKALTLGLVLAGVILVAWMLTSGVDRIGLVSLLLRFAHVAAAMVWIGMIWFVNFVQLAAVRDADDEGREVLLRSIVPGTLSAITHASALTAASGALLLVTTGYVLDRWVFLSVVYVSTPKALMLWGGVLGGIVMLGLAHGVIRPALRVVLGEVPGDAETVTRARARVATFARLNLVLAVPVTFVMVVASHFA